MSFPSVVATCSVTRRVGNRVFTRYFVVARQARTKHAMCQASEAQLIVDRPVRTPNQRIRSGSDV